MPAGFVLPWSPFRTHTCLFRFLGTVPRRRSPTRLSSHERLAQPGGQARGFHFLGDEANHLCSQAALSRGASTPARPPAPVARGLLAGSPLRLGGGEDKMSVWLGPATVLTVPCHAAVTQKGLLRSRVPGRCSVCCLEAVRHMGCLSDGQPGPSSERGSVPLSFGATCLTWCCGQVCGWLV